MEEEEEYESEDNYSNLPDNIDIEDKRPPPAQHHRESGSVEKSSSIILGGETGKNSKEFGSMQSSNKLKASSKHYLRTKQSPLKMKHTQMMRIITVKMKRTV